MARRKPKGKSHKLDGKQWAVIYASPGKNWGLCDHDDRKILIEPNATLEMKFDILVHEGLHACFPYLADWAVDAAATELKDMLIAEGVRLDSSEGGDAQ